MPLSLQSLLSSDRACACAYIRYEVLLEHGWVVGPPAALAAASAVAHAASAQAQSRAASAAAGASSSSSSSSAAATAAVAASAGHVYTSSVLHRAALCRASDLFFALADAPLTAEPAHDGIGLFRLVRCCGGVGRAWERRAASGNAAALSLRPRVARTGGGGGGALAVDTHEAGRWCVGK